MVWVRSPLFWLSFLSAFFFTLSVTTLIFTSVSPNVALEIWIRDDGNRNAYRSIFWILASVSAVSLATAGIMEWKLSQSWEPQWLTKFAPGCVVEGFTSRNHKPMVVLRKPNHEIFELELDKDELKLANEGDVVQVWYIGKYLAHMTPIQSGAQHQIPLGIPRYSGTPKQSILAWILMVGAPAIGGVFCGKGLEHVIFRELTQEYYGEWWSQSGSQAAATGWILMILGLAITGSSAWKWIAGWDDQFLDYFIKPD